MRRHVAEDLTDVSTALSPLSIIVRNTKSISNMSRGKKGGNGVQKRQRQERERQEYETWLLRGRVRHLETEAENKDRIISEQGAENDKLKQDKADLEQTVADFEFQAKTKGNHIELADEKARDAEAFARSLCDQGLKVDASEIISEEEF